MILEGVPFTKVDCEVCLIADLNIFAVNED